MPDLMKINHVSWQSENRMPATSWLHTGVSECRMKKSECQLGCDWVTTPEVLVGTQVPLRQAGRCQKFAPITVLKVWHLFLPVAYDAVILYTQTYTSCQIYKCSGVQQHIKQQHRNWRTTNQSSLRNLFIPVDVETSGALTKETWKLLQEIGRWIEENTGDNKETAPISSGQVSYDTPRQRNLIYRHVWTNCQLAVISILATL